MHALIHHYAAVYLAARLLYKVGIGAHANGNDEYIEIYLLFAVFEVCGVALEFFRAVREEELYALFFKLCNLCLNALIQCCCNFFSK